MPERGTQAQPGEGRPDPGLPGPRTSGPAQPNQGQSRPGPKSPKVSDSAQKSPAFSGPDQQSSVRAESDPQSLHGSDSVQQSPADSGPDLGTPVRRSPSQQSPVGSDPIQQSRVRTDSVNQAPTCSDLFSSGGPAPSTDPAQLLLTGPRPCHRGGRCRELLSTLFIWGIALFVTFVFFWILYDLIQGGIQQLSLGFLLDAPKDAGRAGGIAPILVATLEIVAVCMLVALPVGLGTALLLAEYSDQKRWFGRLVRRSLDVLAAVPSIVFGLFGSAFFSIYLGLGFSILAGGLTLACMVLPIFIRTAEEGLRAVPQSYRLGAASLGISKTSTLFKILLPTALPALSAGFVLGVGRALAETAALLFTSGYVDRMPSSLLDSGRALSVHIYDLAMNVPGGNPKAFATALVLVTLLLAINGAAAWISQRWLRQGITEQ